MTRTTSDTPGVIAPPPLIFLGFLLVGLGLSRLLPDPGLPVPGDWRRYVAFVLIVGGVIIDGAAVGAFRVLGTRPEPWKPSTALATGGLYRFSRNPMYVGFLLIYVGFAVAMNSAFIAALILPCLIVVEVFVIRREERYLATRFSADYEAYRSKVRRWI